MKVRKKHKARQLQIYRSASGQWAARLMMDKSVVATVAGARTPNDVVRMLGTKVGEVLDKPPDDKRQDES